MKQIQKYTMATVAHLNRLKNHSPLTHSLVRKLFVLKQLQEHN